MGCAPQLNPVSAKHHRYDSIERHNRPEYIYPHKGSSTKKPSSWKESRIVIRRVDVRSLDKILAHI